MNTSTIIIIAAIVLVVAFVVKHLISKRLSKETTDVFEASTESDETIATASQLCNVSVTGPEPMPKPDTDNTFTPKDTSEIEVVEPEEITPISEENQICPFEIKSDGNGNIIKTDADREGGVDPLAELEKMIAAAPKTETKKSGKKTGKKAAKTAKKTTKKTGKKTKTTKYVTPTVKSTEVETIAPKKRGRKAKKEG